MSTSPDVIELADATFDKEVVQSDLPFLVDFWAEWCGPCKAIGPWVDDLASKYKGKLKVGKMNIDLHPAVAQRLGIRSIPTLLVFKSGKVVETVVGADKARLLAAVTKATGAA